MPAEVMNADEYSLLLFCEQTYYMISRLPDEATCKQAGHTSSVYKRCVKLPVFNAALEARGIRPYNELDTDGNTSQSLTPEQLNCANVLLEQTVDNRSRKKKLTELGVSGQKFQAWLRDPAFQNYLRVRGEAVLGDHSHDAMLALVNRVQSGDITAIKYYHEITGRYVPQRDAKGVDVQAVLIKVMEIIQTRVTEPALQMSIANDLIELAKESAAMFEGKAITPVAQVVNLPAISPPVEKVPLKRFYTDEESLGMF